MLGGSTGVPVPKWLVIARNEYRVQTSRIRRIRPYFPFLAIGLLAVYVALIAPRLASLFIDDFFALLLSQVAVVMVQVIMFMIFFYFMIIPITDTLREDQTGQMEILLAAPIEPSDVLLGEFMGQMSLYAIFITVIAGLFTAVLSHLGLDIIQMGIIVIIFVIISLSAFWIGDVIAAILRTKLGKTSRGKDIGRGLAMIIALPLVALMYAFMYGGLLEALSDPGTGGVVKTILGLLPSSWGAEVIVGFASNPGNIGAVGFETATRLGGIIAFFITALWLGSKAANRAYSLEPTTFIASTVKPDGVFYGTVKRLGGGGSFGTLLVSVFKDYSRRLENLSNIAYMVGTIVLMNIFIVPEASTGPNDPPVALMMNQFIFPIIIIMVTGEAMVSGKENLFMYRKAPSGIARYIRVMLLKSWLMAAPIAGVITVSTTILRTHSTFTSLLVNTGLTMLIVAANVIFVLGLFLLNPAFSPKSVRLWLNVVIVMFVSIGLFAASMFILIGGGSELTGGFLDVQLVQTVLNWLAGIVFLYFGKRNLARIE